MKIFKKIMAFFKPRQKAKKKPQVFVFQNGVMVPKENNK
jgi:hypothetical protein